MHELILERPDFTVARVGTRIYLLSVRGHLSRAVVAETLKTIWGQPEWQQPWGLVVRLAPDTTYDTDIRTHEVPPNDKRAVGTAVATSSLLHRMVVNSVGVGLRLASRFDLTAHESEGAAIERMTTKVREAEARGRAY